MSNKHLGDMYYYGYGVEKNIDKAIEYYKVASDAGKELATEILREILESNNG